MSKPYSTVQDKYDQAKNLEPPGDGSSIVIFENFGLASQGRVLAYTPIGGDGDEYYRTVWEWDGDGFEKVIEESRFMIHDMAVFIRGDEVYSDE